MSHQTSSFQKAFQQRPKPSKFHDFYVKEASNTRKQWKIIYLSSLENHGYRGRLEENKWVNVQNAEPL
jgi:hypothetical protein